MIPAVSQDPFSRGCGSGLFPDPVQAFAQRAGLTIYFLEGFSVFTEMKMTVDQARKDSPAFKIDMFA